MLFAAAVAYPSMSIWNFLIVILSPVATIFLVWKLQRLVKWYRFFQELPGDPEFSIFNGNLHKLPKGPEERIAYGRYNMDHRDCKLARMWIGPLKPTLIVYHPETVKEILKSQAPKARGFGRVYEMLLPWIGEGLIVSNGSTWYRSRRLITPAFHFEILKPYVAVYNNAADKLLEKLNIYAKSGEPFDVHPILQLCTLDVILKCAMSYDMDVQSKEHDPYAEASKSLGLAFGNRARNPKHWVEAIYKRTSEGKKFFKDCNFVHSVAESVIKKRREELVKDGPPKKRLLDFIDLLLMARDEDGQPMTTMQIRNEVDTFMFAGHDTTSSSITWFLYCLAKYPDHQVKLQEEIDDILEGRDSQHIQWEDLSQLHWLTLCLKESQRMYPPVPFISRDLAEDTEVGGRIFPAGTNVTVAIIHLHRNKAVWDEPDEFRPERFSPEQSKGRDSFSYIPFSAGSRNCIGQHFALDEIKVMTCRILSRFMVELVPGYPEARRYPQATLQVENGMWLQLKSRAALEP